jgi:uncharacterized protein DUF4440
VTRRSIVLLGVVAAAVLAWGIERLIVTDREAIEAAVERGARAVERGDWDAVASIFDDEAIEGGRSKSDLVKYVKSSWAASGATSLSAEVLDLTVSGDRASSRIRARPGGRGLAYGEGVVSWVRRGDGWKATGISNPQVGAGFGR